MIKSRHFWFGAIIIAVLPVLAIDIGQHILDWQKDVREELIFVVQNVYSFSKQQKENILDEVFERNQNLMFLIYLKSFAVLILLFFSIYFFRLYRKQQNTMFLKAVFHVVFVLASFTLIKVFLINRVNPNRNIRILRVDQNILSIQQLYNDKFMGKVVYVDFWGTTCGPCLLEFRDFTKPLKDKYKHRDDIKYLYVAQGNEYLWREQIKKYNVEGDHIFTDEKQYDNLYREATGDSSVLMPHYLIINKNGNIVESNARQPSDGDSLYIQLDKYLAEK